MQATSGHVKADKDTYDQVRSDLARTPYKVSAGQIRTSQTMSSNVRLGDTCDGM